MNGITIREMASNGQVDELFEELLNEFKRIQAKNSYSDSHLAKLYMMKWYKVAGQNPDRMAAALKDYLNSE